MTRPPRRPFRDHERDAKYPHTIREPLSRAERMARIVARFDEDEKHRAIAELFRGSLSAIGMLIRFSEDGLSDVARSLCRDCAAGIKADRAYWARVAVADATSKQAAESQT